MSLGTSNRDGGKTSESGHLRPFSKIFNGNILGPSATALKVSQRATSANMSVDIAAGDAILYRSDGTYGHTVFNDAVYNLVVSTADVSNPRRDIVVIYIDYGQTPSTAVSNNTNGVVKIIVVAGTPAGGPSDPTNSAIQSAVGSGNPWAKLARIRVSAGATTLSNTVIDDLRTIAAGPTQGGWVYDGTYTWTYATATSFTISGVDVTAQFPIGTKLALYQSGGIKYFTVTGSAFATNTTVTITGMGLYTLTNVPIDKPAFSYDVAPTGFTASANYNPYRWQAYLSTSLPGYVPQNTNVRVPFDVKVYDPNGNLDVTTNKGRYTVPITGVYHFDSTVNAAFSNTSTDESPNVYLAVNGAVVRAGEYQPTGPGGNMSYGIHTDLKLNAGDYVETLLRHNGNYAVGINGDANGFVTFATASLVSVM